MIAAVAVIIIIIIIIMAMITLPTSQPVCFSRLFSSPPILSTGKLTGETEEKMKVDLFLLLLLPPPLLLQNLV